METNPRRFRERDRRPGFKNAKELWEEALSQVEEGWLHKPAPLSSDGDPPFFEIGHTNVVFRFGVSHGKKLRACGDLRRNLANTCTAILTPITLPTWDHIRQMAKSIVSAAQDWVFTKGDHASAYKQLPIAPEYANLSVAALRGPASGQWKGFIPKVLLFGSVSAVLHYNVFARSLAVLINRFLCTPMVCYYDDFGSLVILVNLPQASVIFKKFFDKLGDVLNPEKSKYGDTVKFLGLKGQFPSIQGGVLLRIFLPKSKVENGRISSNNRS